MSRRCEEMLNCHLTWENMIFYNDDGMKLLAYNKMTVILWGAVQHLISEKDELL